ncbi:CoA transferase, partial [Algoriphagus aestuarii]|nr:CoA transferase [Algoriphagus aestuarii]
LVRRATTGRGEHIHVSLLNSALSALVQVGQSALVTGAEPERVGHAHPSIVPYQTFPTADGDIIIAAGNDALYRALCTVVERPDLAEDPRFRRNADRVAHRDILVAELTAALAKRSAEEWTALLSDAGVPVGKVRGVAEALRTADASGDEATMTVDHPVLGAVELIRPGFRFTSAAPQHGP